MSGPRPSEWDALAGWWVEEVDADPAYREEVVPLALHLLGPSPGARYLDLGCGEGQVMRALVDRGARAVGCDLSPDLLGRAKRAGPVVRARLPELDWLRAGSVDGALLVLVLEHLAELGPLFEGLAACLQTGAVLVAVMNHPACTAPGSGPVIDPVDGEILWRWGPYLRTGSSRQPAGSGEVTFIHRPLGEVLGAASRAGWCLERLEERGVGQGAAERDPLLAGQLDVPRLLGARWRRW